MGKIAKQTKPYSNIRNGWCKWNRYKMESQYPYPRRSYGHTEYFYKMYGVTLAVISRQKS